MDFPSLLSSVFYSLNHTVAEYTFLDLYRVFHDFVAIVYDIVLLVLSSTAPCLIVEI